MAEVARDPYNQLEVEELACLPARKVVLVIKLAGIAGLALAEFVHVHDW